MFSSGTTSSGSGELRVGTGTSSKGKGGSISISVGDGASKDGGVVTVIAGKTTGSGTTTGNTKGHGGHVFIAGGETTADEGDEKTGGIMSITGGVSSSEHGGHIYMATGVNSEHTGGFMSLFTDQGTAQSSGSLVGANAGTAEWTNGVAALPGALTFSSGTTSSGSSGELRGERHTGTSSKGTTGVFHQHHSTELLEMGPSEEMAEGWSQSLQARLLEQVNYNSRQHQGPRWNVFIAGGETTADEGDEKTGGIISITGGVSSSEHGGHIYMATGVNSEHTGGFMSLFTDRGTATSTAGLWWCALPMLGLQG